MMRHGMPYALAKLDTIVSVVDNEEDGRQGTRRSARAVLEEIQDCHEQRL